jgi:hypothetical protein
MGETTVTSAAALAAQRFVDLVVAGRYGETAELFAEDAEFLPPTGERLVGREAFREFITAASSKLVPERFWILSSVAEGNRCVIEVAARFPGEPQDAQHVGLDHFTVNDDGLFIRMCVYVRPAEMDLLEKLR